MEQFKKVFDENFEDVYDFINEEGWKELNGTVVDSVLSSTYDSYGNEDSILYKVIHFPDYDGGIYVKFSGTRQSYSGEEWEDMKQVFPQQVITTVYK